MGGEESTPWGQQGAPSVESLGGLRGAKNEDPEGVLTRQEWYTYFRKLNLVKLLQPVCGGGGRAKRLLLQFQVGSDDCGGAKGMGLKRGGLTGGTSHRELRGGIGISTEGMVWLREGWRVEKTQKGESKTREQGE